MLTRLIAVVATVFLVLGWILWPGKDAVQPRIDLDSVERWRAASTESRRNAADEWVRSHMGTRAWFVMTDSERGRRADAVIACVEQRIAKPEAKARPKPPRLHATDCMAAMGIPKGD